MTDTQKNRFLIKHTVISGSVSNSDTLSCSGGPERLQPIQKSVRFKYI